jgi:hypothetical protein
MKRSRRGSSFAHSLGRYERPEPGEEILTEYGTVRVLRLVPYEEVVEEMKRNHVSGEEIEGFDSRVEYFLGDRRKYFECELRLPSGDVERLDWSEYYAMKNRRKGRDGGRTTHD